MRERYVLFLLLIFSETRKETDMEKEKNSDGIGYMKRLRRPIGQIDVVLDTDAYNEIDDLYALAYMIRSSESTECKGNHGSSIL